MTRINLALQGGGAHGAFTWGVLDVLLQEPDLEIAAVSGTSAGALNGAALKAGLVEGSAEAARENLAWLWEQMGANTGAGMMEWMSSFAPGLSPGTIAKTLEYSPFFMWSDMASRMLSPYHYGPFYSNPLKPIVDEFQYDKLCAHIGPRLFVCATNVRTGKARVFTGQEISTDVILASACLPTLFQAVEIDDAKTGRRDAFWDGGYTGNPALFPLFPRDLPDDIVIVNINPLERHKTPQTPQEIQARMNEISFNSSLMSELRAIAFAKRLISEGGVEKGKMKDVNIHMIEDNDLMKSLSVATKMMPVPSVLNSLKEAGEKAAKAFLSNHRSDLGKNSTVDLQSLYEYRP